MQELVATHKYKILIKSTKYHKNKKIIVFYDQKSGNNNVIICGIFTCNIPLLLL